MNNLINLFIEAIAVGILTVIIGIIISFVISKIVSVNLPKMCKEWNKNHIMEICLFFTGVFIHLFCEVIGLNKWYCKNGVACKNNKK